MSVPNFISLKLLTFQKWILNFPTACQWLSEFYLKKIECQMVSIMRFLGECLEKPRLNEIMTGEDHFFSCCVCQEKKSGKGYTNWREQRTAFKSQHLIPGFRIGTWWLHFCFFLLFKMLLTPSTKNSEIDRGFLDDVYARTLLDIHSYNLVFSLFFVRPCISSLEKMRFPPIVINIKIYDAWNSKMHYLLNALWAI